MAKKKTVETTIKSWDEANEVLLNIAHLEAELKAAESEMNKELQAVRDKYDAQTELKRQEKFTDEVNLQTFVELHEEELKGKSKKLLHGSVRISCNPPKVSLMNKKFKWDTVLALVKAKFGKKYIRETIEINKEQILGGYNGKIKLVSDADLAACGIKIDQRERFSYKINWESIPELINNA